MFYYDVINGMIYESVLVHENYIRVRFMKNQEISI